MTPDDDTNPILETEFGPEEKGAQVFLDNASDVRQIKRKGRRKKLSEENSLAFWKGVFSTAIGRAEMWKILEKVQTFELVLGFSPNGATSTEATLYKIGQQQLGLHLYHKWLSDFPELVYLMHAENDKRNARAGSERSKAITSNARSGPDSDTDE